MEIAYNNTFKCLLGAKIITKNTSLEVSTLQTWQPEP